MLDQLIRNPAVLIGLFRAVIILAISFGVSITTAQQDSILELVGAVTAMLSLLLTGLTAYKTTPRGTPTLDAGTVVKVVTPEGQSHFITTV